MAAQGSSNNQGALPPDDPQKVLERKFWTPPPDSKMMDNIIIEIRHVNGVPFSYKEAKYGIFCNCLDMHPKTIHCLRFAFSDYPIIKYKLKHQINIASLKPREFFEFQSSYRVNGKEKCDVLQCKIKGIN